MISTCSTLFPSVIMDDHGEWGKGGSTLLRVVSGNAEGCGRM